jgi:NAD(P)-dependent dehydrogenase (short-subunit alcohol dehydrogenase family)
MNQTCKLAGGLVLGLGAGLAYAAIRNHQPYHFFDRVAVITGGSRGLGLLMARKLAAEGARLALLARDPAELQRAQAELAAQGASVLSVPCDMSDRNQVTEAIGKVARHFGRIDVLINNAGIIQVGPLEHMAIEDFEKCMAVHFYGPLYATWAALPHMMEARSGRIVNITSIGGKIAFPHLLPYTASKFALVGFSDGLRVELRRHNIRVTTVFPGLMRTGSPRNALFKGQHQREYAWFAISDSLPLLSIDADRAAEQIVDACRSGKAHLTIGVQTRAAILWNDIFPGATTQMLALINRLMPGPDFKQGDRTQTGQQSQSWAAPSFLTRLSDEAAVRNNETGASA